MEHVIFHHNGREFTIYDALTNDELRTIMRMNDERNRKLDALNAKSMRRYFEDTDKMVLTILKRCFRLTEAQIAAMEEPDRRNLAHAFVRFLATANKLTS